MAASLGIGSGTNGVNAGAYSSTKIRAPPTRRQDLRSKADSWKLVRHHSLAGGAPLKEWGMCGVAIAAFVLAPAGMRSRPMPSPRNAAADRKAIVSLESKWLNAENAATLDRILAPDFVRLEATGGFLTKASEISWVTSHPAPAGVHRQFVWIRVRLYGDTGVVNGVVVTTGRAVSSKVPAPPNTQSETRATKASGAELRRSAFTDVFVYRSGRWQAVNAQENIVVAPQASPREGQQ
jgi:hypothetical protein